MPGADFGTAEPARHVRFAFTTDTDRIDEGLARMAAFLGRRA
jgi:aspartate/methionine/tyrosine aminotransferase